MGQYLPDRLFWAREEAETRSDEAAPAPLPDVRGSH